MEYVASYLLLKQNGQEANKATITKLLSTINATIDPEAIDLFLSKVEGKSLEEIMETGSALMVSQRAASASSAAPAANASSSAAKVEAQEEKEESSDDAEIGFF